MQRVAMGTPSGVTSADDVSGRRNAGTFDEVPVDGMQKLGSNPFGQQARQAGYPRVTGGSLVARGEPGRRPKGRGPGTVQVLIAPHDLDAQADDRLYPQTSGSSCRSLAGELARSRPTS
jgi:hypothetical protein